MVFKTLLWAPKEESNLKKKKKEYTYLIPKT